MHRAGLNGLPAVGSALKEEGLDVRLLNEGLAHKRYPLALGVRITRYEPTVPAATPTAQESSTVSLSQSVRLVAASESRQRADAAHEHHQSRQRA